MIEIRPRIAYQPRCPRCGATLPPERVIWQGIHTCCQAVCGNCKINVIADLPIAHAMYYPYVADTTNNILYGENVAKQWFGKPLLTSFRNPENRQIELHVEKFASHKKVVIINCIDFLYGHALLKLFNVERHLRDNPDFGVIVIAQNMMRWMVPKGVAEIWSVDTQLSKAQHFYEKLDERIQKECLRFETIFLSKAYTHPSIERIQSFTGIEPHDFSAKDFRITFVWREDRPWIAASKAVSIGKRLKLSSAIVSRQQQKVVSLFSMLRKRIPHARFTVAGLGTLSTFPSWIDDRRVKSFSDDIEKSLCQVYAGSRVVIGVHGSHMLLPSAHAGMTVDLMPADRWGNFAQDIVYQENNSRMGSYRYRYVPIATSIETVCESIVAQVEDFEYFKRVMTL